MTLLYFAWLRTRIGVGRETMARPDGVATVGQLMAWLKTRSAGHAEAFADERVVRAAVNQDFAAAGTPVGDDDEVAFFPPVTGG